MQENMVQCKHVTTSVVMSKHNLNTSLLTQFVYVYFASIETGQNLYLSGLNK